MTEKIRNTILIVDDIQTNREILCRLFSENYNILEADDGVKALEAMRQTEVCTILLDLSMPVMDGFAVLEEMRKDETLVNIPVIVVTSYDDKENQNKAIKLGAADFISKPINPETVCARVRNIAEVYRGRKLVKESQQLLNRIMRQDRALKLAEIDKLTGLFNREAFCSCAKEMISAKPDSYYTIACFDIDNFKVFNDQYGSLMGNQVLIQVARTVGEYTVKSGGMTGRMYADNFAAIYSTEKEISYPKIIKEINDALSRSGMLIPLKLSFGCYTVTDCDLSVDVMLDRALLAKSTVKGRYDKHIEYYTESMRDEILEQQWIASMMERALMEEQFEVWFQPQYNHATGAMVGAEALVRWMHPERGLIMPTKFVPAFERNGFIYALDKFVWRQTCKYIREWLDDERIHDPLPVSVNVSRYDVYQPDFLEVIEQILDEYDIPRDMFRIEITETAFTKSTDQIISIVQQLRNLGLIVEIDDFGSGYSSFNTLKDVPANVLKIDMRFLEGSANSERGGSILQSIVRMAKWLDMPVIAEGVETREQADFLYSIGCMYVQGFLYARPMLLTEYEALLESGKTEKYLSAMETIDRMDADAFWSPQSLETLVFNRYAGGACVFEFMDDDIEILRINEKYVSIFNISKTPEQMLKVPIFATFDEQSKADALKTLHQAIESGDEGTFEAKLTLSSDKIGYYRYYIRMIARADKRYLFYCYVEDVTKQRLAEEELRKSNEKLIQSNRKLRFLNEASQCLLADVLPVNNINGTMERILQYFNADRAYVIELNWDEGNSGTTYEVCAKNIASAREEYQNIPIERFDPWLADCVQKSYLLIDYADEKSEKNVRSIEGVEFVIAAPLRRDGNIIGFICVDNPKINKTEEDNIASIGDYMAVILTRRDYEQKLENDNEKMRYLMNDIPGGFARYYYDKKERLMLEFVNDGLCDMLGMTREEFVKMHKDDAYVGVHKNDVEKLRNAIKNAAVDGKPYSIKYRLMTKTGDYKPMMIFGRVTKDSDDHEYFNVYYSDMPEQVD